MTDLTDSCDQGPPQARGLYHPRFEHDACGVGFVCNLSGVKSHDIIRQALQILKNLTHRGACGCDATTGDGAGILIQIPHQFLSDQTALMGIDLPDPQEYGVGSVFLPPDQTQRRRCVEMFGRVVRREGLALLGWRAVPIVPDALGDNARRVLPHIRQVFIGRGRGIRDAAHFERKLYVVRKVIEHAVRRSDLSQKRYFYVASLSCNTLLYKGMLLADQIESFYPDLAEPTLASGLALVHQRYSTNTFPDWPLAQPFRFICHNGEINTLRGNINWMHARQHLFQSDLFGPDMPKLLPVLTPDASDSAILDNAIELLYHTGRSLPHAVMMLIPEAWQNHETMSDEKRAFYEYHSCLMEPWDGPASIPFTDGHCIGAVLDRNGLRPSRYTVTKDGLVVMASETGVLDIDPANVLYKGRLQPGRMFLVDTDQGRIVDDEEIKSQICHRRPYRAWLNEHLVRLEDLPDQDPPRPIEPDRMRELQRTFGYSLEDLRILIGPMAKYGKEPVGSMGNDAPLAVLSDRPCLLYDYFKQLFAQVTNPPLDAIREELVTSLVTNIGAEHDLFQETPKHCHLLKLPGPILTNRDLRRIEEIGVGTIRATKLSMLFDPEQGGRGLEQAMERLCAAATQAVDDGFSIIILSDRGTDRGQAPIPALLATAGVHHHLIRQGRRTRCGLVVESAEPREVHHFCLLLGYGAGAVNPYLAVESIRDLIQRDFLPDLNPEVGLDNYIKSIGAGILKVMSKMGISTLQSYRGAQIFEAVGLSRPLIDKYFTWTPSRVGGVGIDVIAAEARSRHHSAYPARSVPRNLDLDVGGKYQWRRNGEHHMFNPLTIAKLQQATRSNDAATYRQYAELVNGRSRKLATLRGLLTFNCLPQPIPIEEVEHWTRIVRRFKSGAMSYGSLSQEAHETIAIAMNRLGAKSNSGEGGEDPARYKPDENGEWRNSAIKQVASGRFGVTSNYLVNAAELQIKMAQGAKPGEGGQLPGEKVYPWIAKVRHSTPYVQLISPPPHHDIYSIEDLAQLIHDLKNANPRARISVKLVSEVGVGTIAAGVAKGKADVILISGHDGGTGASPQGSIMHAGLPWELGLSETHQTLVLNDLRSRVILECDGKLKTGRDVAVACLLGAEEFGFATAPLIAAGCVMMRKCHLNTCPVGVATQDPVLRKRFAGKPDHVINFFYFVAQELRQIMARLGFRTVDEMVGRVDKLEARRDVAHWKAKTIDLSRVLYQPEAPPHAGTRRMKDQDHGLDHALDHELIAKAEPALQRAEPVEINLQIRNVNRTLGTMLSSEISRRCGEAGLPPDTIVVHCRGSAGQSFAAFGARGLTMRIEGDANDYFGKGLSGAKLIIFPPHESTFKPEENILIGNVALYGATAGEVYVRGLAGERFGVRNSGARAVVEGVGDHGCEYMTGGRVVVLGPTGRNFAAGMSGGLAYVLDESRRAGQAGDFAETRCNLEMCEVEGVEDPADVAELREMIENHFRFTASGRAKAILDQWPRMLGCFVKVMPTDYKRALERLAGKRPVRVGPPTEDETVKLALEGG